MLNEQQNCNLYGCLRQKQREEKRLLCTKCMDNLESNLNNVLSFQKLFQQLKKIKKGRSSGISYYGEYQLDH
ncbi:unnamed protein product [Paramecium octaurelia]|uniref:Uncharacterized protein n=1 Tax=Paramecium octaurelia TaxID=43137 RepID=A0A8S1WH17_PAROT|nr:unnamed protein product [Paramecium octaurelia]